MFYQQSKWNFLIVTWCARPVLYREDYMILNTVFVTLSDYIIIDSLYLKILQLRTVVFCVIILCDSFVKLCENTI